MFEDLDLIDPLWIGPDATDTHADGAPCPSVVVETPGPDQDHTTAHTNDDRPALTRCPNKDCQSLDCYYSQHNGVIFCQCGDCGEQWGHK